MTRWRESSSFQSVPWGGRRSRRSCSPSVRPSGSPRVNVTEHDSWDAYRAAAAVPDARLWLTSGKRGRPIWEAEFHPGDHLVFGKETAGLPSDLLDAHPERVITIPMVPGERGLNVATAVSAVLTEGVRQCVVRGDVLVSVDGRLSASAQPRRGAGE